jgi:lipid-binding SYLF domain-containing protein
MRVERTAIIAILGAAACASTPKTHAQKANLEQSSAATIGAMADKDPSLRDLLHDANAYAVFPEIGKGGVIVGGAHGTGMLYERGKATGFVTLDQASIGAQLGGETFSEVLVMTEPEAVDHLKTSGLSLGADVGATVVDAGAAASADLRDGMAAFVLPRGGLMVDISVSGQKIDYQPLHI